MFNCFYVSRLESQQKETEVMQGVCPLKVLLLYVLFKVSSTEFHEITFNTMIMSSSVVKGGHSSHIHSA